MRADERIRSYDLRQLAQVSHHLVELVNAHKLVIHVPIKSRHRDTDIEVRVRHGLEGLSRLVAKVNKVRVESQLLDRSGVDITKSLVYHLVHERVGDRRSQRYRVATHLDELVDDLSKQVHVHVLDGHSAVYLRVVTEDAASVTEVRRLDVESARYSHRVSS